MTRQSFLDVGIGEIGYSRLALRSENFMCCSAVVLYYEDSAFLAHVFSTTFSDPTYAHEVTYRNVVEKLISRSKKIGLDIKEGKAIINAGKKKILDSILKDFKVADIFVREANTKHSPNLRTVTYNPRTKLFQIIPFRESLVIYSINFS